MRASGPDSASSMLNPEVQAMAPAEAADIVSFPTFAKPVTRDQFIDAMGQAVTGVTIITTSGGAGRAGITVSAVSSVTADPPVLLACVHRDSPACEKVRRNGTFCVNLLKDSQSAVADVFAGRGDRDAFESKFDCTFWGSLVTGAPAMRDALSAFDCRLQTSRVVGSHRVFFGVVVGTWTSKGVPLLYASRAYGRPHWG